MPRKKNYQKQYDFSDSSEDFIDSDTQLGGESQETESEPGVDNATIDIDPDDEKDIDTNEDDKYDPINEFDEPEDTDEETGEAEEEREEEMESEELETEEYLPVAKICHMKNLNKDFVVPDEDESLSYEKSEYKKIEDADRITDPIMTYYEMVRIIGTRAQQFNLGAEPLVEGLDKLHAAKMAYLELIAKMTPFIIRRYLPGKKYEEWKIDELQIIHQIDNDFFVPDNFDPSLSILSNGKTKIKEINKNKD